MNKEIIPIFQLKLKFEWTFLISYNLKNNVDECLQLPYMVKKRARQM